MELVKNLSWPLLTECQVTSLEEDGIKTLLDIVDKDKLRVMSAAKLNLANCEALREEVLQLILPKPITGMGFALSTQPSLMSTGIKGLDLILNGGLQGGEVLEIFGDVATGKTQICLAISAQFLMSRCSVAYFDLKCHFSSKRLLQFCKGVRDKLRNITIIRPCNMTELLEDLGEIRREIVSREDQTFSNLKLMIFDSIPMIMYPTVDGDVMSWRYYQESFIEKVRQLSKLNNGIATVFVNHSVNRRSGFKTPKTRFDTNLPSEKSVIVKPALGSGYWSHKPNFRLQLTKDLITNDVRYDAVLRKSSRTACDQKFSFSISHELSTL